MMDRLNILVVDPEQESVEALVKAFKTSGFGATSATSGRDALARAEEEQFDIALVDAELSDMSGIELIRRFVKTQPHIVTALMAANSSLEEGLEAFEVGVVRYIFKPLDGVSGLPRIIREAASERELRLRRVHSLSIAELEENHQAPVRVLLVDPSSANREALVEALAETNCEITEAIIGQEALALFNDGEYHALVFALDMGDMMADDLLSRIRRMSPDVGTIVISTSPSLQMLATLMRNGADGIIPNPLDDKEQAQSVILRHARAARVRMSAETLDELVEKAARYTVVPPPMSDAVPTGPSALPTASFADRARAVRLFDDGLIALKEKRYDDALFAWRDAVTLHPTNRWYRWNLRKLKKIAKKSENKTATQTGASPDAQTSNHGLKNSDE